MKHLSILAVALNISLFLSAQVVTPCENGFAGEYACDGYDLLTHYPLSAVGGGDNGNDCWGWVDEESGREYVIFGRSNGTSFVEITDPLNPQFIATMPTASTSSLWRDIKVIGDYAYIGSEAPNHGIQIMDLSQLLPLSGFTYNISPTYSYAGFGNAHNIVACPETEFIYGVGTNTFNGGLHIVDVSDPSSPTLAGSFSEFYTHDAQAIVYNGPDVDYQGSEIVICFNGSAGIAIVNADDKTDVQLIKAVTYEESAYTHQGWISEDHTMVYFNDELDEQYIGNNTRTYMMDVTDLDNPVIVGFYESDSESIDHNLYTHEGKVYASNYTSGLIVSNILEDGSIEPQGFFDTYPSDDGTSFDGTWSNYPYFPSGTIAVSNFDGLFLLRSSDWIDSVDPTNEQLEAVFSLSPNPSSHIVTLNGSFRNCDIRVFDISGRKVMSYSNIPSVDGLNINVSDLKEGVYSLSLVDSTSGKFVANERLVVSH